MDDPKTGRRPWFHRQRFFVQFLLLFVIIFLVMAGADLLQDGLGIFSQPARKIAGFLAKNAATALIWSLFMVFLIRDKTK